MLVISVFGQIVCTAMFLFPRAKLYKITEITKIITEKFTLFSANLRMIFGGLAANN